MIRVGGGTYNSFRSLGLMMGYLGFNEDPAYILPKISSERVSWLSNGRDEWGLVRSK